jgi:hypothetical protein
MRRLLLSLIATSALALAALLTPAQAMTVGTASGIQAAIVDTNVAEEVRYVCRHRWRSSRRVCWWRPDFYRPYRPWRHRHWRSRRW